MAQTFGDEDPRPFGFDAAVEFPPHKLGADAPRINAAVEMLDHNYEGNIYEYDHLVKRATSRRADQIQTFSVRLPQLGQ